MKDLEKIKSEDLAAQVQDANPANFAIEQEVAQLVGATVPQPTEPSADDARELPAQLLVFLRRALLPIRSALRTALAAIYAHLDSRCTDYTPAAYAPFRLPAGPYDPMRPFVPRTLPNLLQAITSFSARKISNGSAPSDGIPDGISLVHLLAVSSATRLVDDNSGWTMTKDNLVSTLASLFPNYDGSITIRCNKATARIAVGVSSLKRLYAPELVECGELADNCSNVENIYIPKLRKCSLISNAGRHNYYFIGYNNCPEIDAPELVEFNGPTGLWGNSLFRDLPNCKKISAKKLTNWGYQYHHSGSCAVFNCPVLEELYLNSAHFSLYDSFTNCDNLILIEIAPDYSQSLALWSPTNALSSSASDLVADPTAHPTWKNLDQFLQNFKEHIALRLTANGSGKTLTLSQAVRDAIHAAEATYGIEAIIVTQKGWTLSPAPTA